jgi:hypothetical protein
MGQSQTSLLSEVCDQVESLFGQCPCLCQIRVVPAILKNDKDIQVVSVSPTGSIEAFVDKFATIVEGKHRAIVTNIKPDEDFEKLFQIKDFMSKEKFGLQGQVSR